MKKYWSFGLTGLVLGLNGCILDGGGNNNSNSGSGATTNISASVSGTTVMVIDDRDRIVALDDTTGRAPDLDRNGDSILESFTIDLSGVPVGREIRVFVVSSGAILSMYFDTNNDAVPDSNVFVVNGEVPIVLGFMDVTTHEELGFAEPQFNPSELVSVSVKGRVEGVPPVVQSPPTEDLTVAELNARGLAALEDTWALGARTYFEAAAKAAGDRGSADSDTAFFFLALTRVAALGYDTLSDGNPGDMNRLADMLDLIDVPNDAQRGSPELIEDPRPLPSDSPTGNEGRDFLYDVATPELEAAVDNLDKVSRSFEQRWFEPLWAKAEVESDYGDVLFFRGAFKAALSAIATQKAYDLDADIDNVVNTNSDNDDLNDITVESFVADPVNASTLSLSDTTRLAEAKRWLIASAIDDLDDALVEMDRETDDQLDDLVTLDDIARDGLDLAREYLDNVKDSIESGVTSLDPDDEVVTDLQRFYDVGVDFRNPDRLPDFAGNRLEGTNPCFPDPTFNSVLLLPDSNEDLNANGTCDVAE